MSELRAGYKVERATHDGVLSDGARSWFFNFDDVILEDPTQPSTVMGGEGGGYWGDFEQDHIHVTQDDFTGGRGRYNFLDDESSYFDSGMANTMIPNRVVPVGQVRFGEVADADNLLPGGEKWGVSSDVHFTPLIDGERKYAQFVSVGYTVARAFVWLRKVGHPTGNLTIAVYANAASKPSGTAHTSVTLAETAVSDSDLSQLVEISGLDFALVAGTTYWVGIWSSGNDSSADHWEIGTGHSATGTLYLESTDAGSTFITSAEQIFVRLAAAYVNRSWRYFQMEGALYRVSNRPSGTEDALWINGDRGIATAGATTTITDSTKAWSASQYIGARVRITKGVGVGQSRGITANSSTALTVSPAWDVTPTSTSEYVIYATDHWRTAALTTSGIGEPVTGVTVFNNQALMAFGSGRAMLRIKWDAGIPGHLGRDEGGAESKADIVHAGYDSSANAVRVWKGENNVVDVRSAAVPAWGTDVPWGDATVIGESTWLIKNMRYKAGALWIAKEDSVWFQSAGKFVQVELGFDTAASEDNGLVFLSWKSYVYYGFGHTLEQLFEGNVVDMGPWLHAGLPSGRTGRVSCGTAVHAYMFLGVDGGADSLSSVQAWNERGYHEVFRGWKVDRRVQDIFWQACPGDRPRLWMSVGGETMVQEWPKNTLNPLNDSTYVYHHECYVTQGVIDMRNVDLPKLFKDLTIASENLSQDTTILSQYQVDTGVRGTTWASLAGATFSPIFEQEIGEGQRSRIELRHILRTQEGTTPPMLLAAVLSGIGRLPTKYQWVFTVPVESLQMSGQGVQSADPEDFVEWLKDVSTKARMIRFDGRYKSMDGVRVIVSPPQTLREGINPHDGSWAGRVQFAVRLA
jgi:hypothetical protein